MKAATLRRFLTVHTWTGLIAGMALFIAFYAGALTIFQASTLAWQRPELRALPVQQSPTQLDRLLADVVQANRSARESVWVYLPSPFAPRPFVFWHDKPTGMDRLFVLDADARVRDLSGGSDLAHLVNHVHFTLGLPESLGTYLMGLVSIVYGLALVSGVIVHLPTMAKDLFALRRGGNLKRFWQDAHNVIGVLSLPFHVIVAFTGVLLCILVLFVAGLDRLALDRQAAPLYRTALQVAPRPAPLATAAPVLPMARLLAAVSAREPTLQPLFLNYRNYGDRAGTVTVSGHVPGYLADYGQVTLNAATATVLGVQLPGERSNAHAALRTVTSLHFGTYGGLVVQGLYFVLGLGGAFLFYSGNLLWIESRRKRRMAEQPRVQRFLARLTVGVCLGCCAGLAAAYVAALALRGVDGLGAWEWRIYYGVFLGSIAWAQLRPPVRAAIELALLGGVLTLAVPVTNALVTGDHLLRTAATGQWQVFGVDAVALALGTSLLWIARKTARRARDGDPNSVWSHAARDGARAYVPAKAAFAQRTDAASR